MFEMITISLGLADQIAILTEEEKIARVKAEETAKHRVLLRILTQALSRPVEIILRQCLEKIKSTSAKGSRKAWGEIMNACQIQEKIINGVRDFEVGLTGKIRIETQALTLLPMLQSLPHIFASELAAKHLTINIEGPADNLQVKSNPCSIERLILGAVMANAIKYSRDHGRIVVFCAQGEGEVCITISDNGVGMELEQLEHAFNPFRRKTTPGTKGELGLGFGLSLAQMHLAVCGGRIEVESRTTAKAPSNPGTRVRIFLALQKPASTPTPLNDVA